MLTNCAVRNSLDKLCSMNHLLCLTKLKLSLIINFGKEDGMKNNYDLFVYPEKKPIE